MTRSVNPNGMPNLLSIANVGDALGGNTSLDGQSYLTNSKDQYFFKSILGS
jgi:hypothetical protein